KQDTVQITSSNPLTISGCVTNTNCNVCCGSVSVTVSGGTPPYRYSPSNYLSGLCAGTYSFRVTDATDCSNTASFTVARNCDTVKADSIKLDRKMVTIQDK